MSRVQDGDYKVYETMVTLNIPAHKKEGIFFNLSKHQNVEISAEPGLSNRYKLEPGDYHTLVLWEDGKPRLVCNKVTRG